jgi:hypothetical protein
MTPTENYNHNLAIDGTPTVRLKPHLFKTAPFQNETTSGAARLQGAPYQTK